MYSRITICGLVALLAGCANETVSSPWNKPMANLGAIALMDETSADTTAELLAPKKTMASKVLSSLAFERVTGLPTDPARLLEAE